MMEELMVLEANQTWEIIPHPADASVIGSKWIYSIKIKADGNLDRCKAHLVAQGYKHAYGIVYEETFVLVAKMTTTGTFLGVSPIRNWPLW